MGERGQTESVDSRGWKGFGGHELTNREPRQNWWGKERSPGESVAETVLGQDVFLG